MTINHKTLIISIALGLTFQPALSAAQGLTEALTDGEASGLFNLRYEAVEQDNSAEDAEALTLRSVLQYDTASYRGFSATLQVEDVRVIGGLDDYTVGPTNFNPGVYSVIADPETTEVNQGFLQYAADDLRIRAGRQILTYDNHRFIGSVAWRQDWQVYDALSADYEVSDQLTLNYAWLDRRERIFAEAADVDADDHLFRAAYQAPFGTLVGYAYLLEQRDSPLDNDLDTYGMRLSGEGDLGGLPASYLVEYATQEAKNGPADYDADYFLLEAGLTAGGVTAKLGHERLGSDGGDYGFATPLATLHAFNGWADMFLNTPDQGLRDSWISAGGKLAGGSWTVTYHDFEADRVSAGIEDLGSEVDLSYTRRFGEHYTLGVKYADYDSGDSAALPDTQRFWVWFQARF